MATGTAADDHGTRELAAERLQRSPDARQAHVELVRDLLETEALGP
jgi:hypothetical protein